MGASPTARLLTGIDGCRGGWIAAIGVDGKLGWRFSPDIEELLKPVPVRALIDMPFGLAEAGPRTCEQLARAGLEKRKSSIFPMPVREAIYAPSYQEACRVNERRTGKKLSKQAWNIVPKIKELDALLQRRPSLEPRLVESHPELCFQRLNRNTGLRHGKRSREGVAERITILERFVPAEELFESALDDFPRRDVQADDLLDALCLLVVAMLPSAQREQMPYPAPRDAMGLRMRIVCARPIH